MDPPSQPECSRVVPSRRTPPGSGLPLDWSGGEAIDQPVPELIPLFPLHAVLFPGAVMPLNVFEERYRLLVRERLDFGVVLIRRGSEVGPGRAEDLHDVGTVATLQRIEALPDGGFAVVARGLHRFRLLALDHS